MKHVTCLFLVFALILAAFPAAAAGSAPTSQFGFKGWPYRQETNCASARCPMDCRQCASDRDCAACAYCCQAMATARPADSAPRPTKIPVSTPAPAATPRPTPAPAARPTQQPPASTGDYTTISVTAQEQIALNLLNQDRMRNGLPALTLDAELSRLARLKCEDMRNKKYFAHESPTYGNAAAMLTRFGYAFRGVGENIAHHATVEKAHAAFMSSTGHRGNILGSQWTKVGIGVCQDSQGFVYVTQLFVR